MINQDVVIREAEPADWPAIRELTLAAYSQYADQMPHWESYRDHVLRLVSEDGPATQLVAEQAGVIVGSVLLYPAGYPVYGSAVPVADWPEIRLLAVPPEARGRGIGGALINGCIQWARQAGATSVGLHSEAMMGEALNMYLRRGFSWVPGYDFTPAPGVTVKGYRLALTD